MAAKATINRWETESSARGPDVSCGGRDLPSPSAWRIAELLLSSGFRVKEFDFLDITGCVYRVQYIPTLGSTNCTDLVGDVTASNSTASKTNIMTTTNRFYRIRVLP